MPELEHALRATSDSILATLERLSVLETEKRTLAPADPRLGEMAVEVERLAQSILEATSEQRDLVDKSQAEVASGSVDAPVRPIEDVAPRPMAVILEEWRAAEREAARLGPDDPQAADLDERIDLLRAEYRRAWEAVRLVNGGGLSS